MYPAAPGVMYYPVHPAYFYPYPPPQDTVQVVENEEPAEIVPELPGETVELPWSKWWTGPRFRGMEMTPSRFSGYEEGGGVNHNIYLPTYLLKLNLKK